MSIPDKLEAMESAITVAQFAAVLHLGKTAIYDQVRRNAIPHYRLAGLLSTPRKLPIGCAAGPFPVSGIRKGNSKVHLGLEYLPT